MFMMSKGQSQQNLISVTFQYQVQNGSNQTQLQLQFNVNAIHEYNSSSSTDSYNNQTVQKYPEEFQTIQWGPWVNESIYDNGVYVYIYSSTSLDGILTVRVRATSQPVESTTGILSPNDVKMDFEIHDFPFVGTQTRLAMETNVQSQSRSQNDWNNADDNNQLLFDSAANLPLGAFSWVPVAGNFSEIQVVASSNSAPGYQNQFQIFFSFLTPPAQIHSAIVWDPTLGLQYDIPAPLPDNIKDFCFIFCGIGGILSVVVVGVVAIIVLAVIFILALRKRTDYEPIRQ